MIKVLGTVKHSLCILTFGNTFVLHFGFVLCPNVYTTTTTAAAAAAATATTTTTTTKSNNKSNNKNNVVVEICHRCNYQK